MPIAPLPTPLQSLGGRRFSFYPPIRNIEHNQWMYRRSTWSESVVVNMRSGEEIFIPRMFLAEVSRFDSPVIIVGLTRELEWNAGAVVPHQRRVIELTVAVNEGRPAPSHRACPAQVISIRLEPKRDLPARKWAGVVFALGAVAFTVIASVARQSQTHSRPDFPRVSQVWRQFGPADDYASVTAALGRPSDDRPVSSAGRVYRLLVYPEKHFTIVLAQGRYAGTLDLHGRVLQALTGPMPGY